MNKFFGNIINYFPLLLLVGCTSHAYEIYDANVKMIEGEYVIYFKIPKYQLKKIVRYEYYSSFHLDDCIDTSNYYPQPPELSNGTSLHDMHIIKDKPELLGDGEDVILSVTIPPKVFKEMGSEKCIQVTGGNYFGFKFKSNRLKLP